MKKTLINLALFQFGWAVCVLGGNLYAIIFTIAALIVHQCYILTDNTEWKLIGIITLFGILWDLLMIHSGVISYGNDLVLGMPLWLACLWVLFATTFLHGLFWMSRYLWLAAIFAGIFGPASYWFGSRMIDAQFGMPLLLALTLMAVGWSLLFPSGLYLARRFKT